MSLTIGQLAPDFSLFDTEKKRIHLQDFRGRNVLLLFFPFAFSSICTKELCMVRDNINLYNHVDAEVLGISVDSLYTLARFKQDQQLSFTLLSDFNKVVSQLYNALYVDFNYDMKGVSKRAAFVVDRKGIIRYAEVLENAGEIPNFGAIQSVLSALN